MFLDEVSRRKQPLRAYLPDVEELTFEDDVLTIASMPDLEAKLQLSSNRQIIDEIVAEVWGPTATWRTVRREIKKSEAVETEATRAETAVTENPTVQTVLDIFGGRVERVEERPREE